MWATKYRPMRFVDVLGQEGAVQVLKSRLVKGTALGTSYIFSGGHGRGKTTLARILGRALLCTNLRPDGEPCNECDSCKAILNDASPALSELDAASNGTVEIVRGLVDKLDYVVTGGSKKVYVFDEVHRMSKEAQDVLLKPLEEGRLVGIFCTTEPEKIRGAIRSRCEDHPIRKITREDILKRFKTILEAESVEHEDDAVLTIIDHSGGHVRDAVSKLEMVAQMGSVTLDVVREYLNLSVVSTYYDILLNLGNPATSVILAEEALERVGPEAVAEGIAEAAMNSYRLAHNMFAEFSYVDRDKAVQVHQIYGDSVIRFSEYFLRSYKTSKIALLSDIIACRGGPVTPSVQQQTPIVVTSAPATIVTVVPTTSARTMTTPPPSVVASEDQVQTQSVVTPPSVPPPATGRRSDGVGDKGSSNDPRALTTLDTKGVPQQSARGRDLPKSVAPPTVVIPPSEWRVRFLRLRSGLGGS